MFSANDLEKFFKDYATQRKDVTGWRCFLKSISTESFKDASAIEKFVLEKWNSKDTQVSRLSMFITLCNYLKHEDICKSLCETKKRWKEDLETLKSVEKTKPLKSRDYYMNLVNKYEFDNLKDKLMLTLCLYGLTSRNTIAQCRYSTSKEDKGEYNCLYIAETKTVEIGSSQKKNEEESIIVVIDEINELINKICYKDNELLFPQFAGCKTEKSFSDQYGKYLKQLTMKVFGEPLTSTMMRKISESSAVANAVANASGDEVVEKINEIARQHGHCPSTSRARYIHPVEQTVEPVVEDNTTREIQRYLSLMMINRKECEIGEYVVKRK